MEDDKNCESCEVTMNPMDFKGVPCYCYTHEEVFFVYEGDDNFNCPQAEENEYKDKNAFWIVIVNQDSTEFGLIGSQTSAKLMFDTDGKPMKVLDTFPMSEYDYDAAKNRVEKVIEEYKWS